jgi:hypothetical protein
MGVYISIISFAGTFIRSQLFSIMFDELPQVDALWYFLNDIYFLRTVDEYSIEYDLFHRLIYIFRNPEILIYWTKVPIP